MAAELRETGIAAIGAIPVTWKLERLNNVAELFGRIGWQGLTSDEYTDEGAYLVTGTDFRDGYIDWSSCVHVSEERWEEAWQIKLQEGDLLISKDGTIGKLAIVSDLPGHASLNSGLMRIVPRSNGYVTKYLYYVLQTDVFYDWYREIDAGASTIKHLFQGDFIHFVYPSPPIEEQEAITEELDKSTAEIDHAISLVTQQLEILDDYRKSLIQEAVTKGLNPTVDMKPSGLDWVGDMPIHWQLKKVKNISESRNGLDYVAEDVCGPDDAGATLVVRSSNLDGNGMMFDDCVYLNKRIPSALRLQKDDIVIVRTNGSRELVGKNALVPENGIGTIGAFMLLCRTPYPRYLHWVLNSQLFPRYLGTFETSTVNQITNGNLRNMVVPFCPDPQERDLICDYLDTKCATVDRLIAGKRKQLETLRAQRQSLIYEYVTGKRRVL